VSADQVEADALSVPAGRVGAPIDRPADYPGLRYLMLSDFDRYSYMLELDGTAALPFSPRVVRYGRALLMCQGLKASLVYRVGHALVRWSPKSGAARTVRFALRVGHFIANRMVESATGISISEHAVIGKGLYIAHFSGVIIGVVRIGDHCNLSHGVTIGRSGRRGQTARPVVGDRVWIGPGAVVTGALTIGEDSVVGANSVITRSVPPRATALGAPASVRPGAPSFDMVVYRHSDRDERRVRSQQRLDAERAIAER